MKTKLLSPVNRNGGIISQIGKTPLVKLEKLPGFEHFNVYGKLEMYNPGGSIKDRTALSLIQNAIDSGDINDSTTVIESSSGNLGIGIAQLCNYFGIRFICIVDPLTTKQNLDVLKAYGAECEVVTEKDDKGQYLKSRLRRVDQLLNEIQNSYWPNQYANQNNPKAHIETCSEVFEQLGESVDYFFCAVSSCGTLAGFRQYLDNKNLATHLIAVDAQGSVIYGDSTTKRILPGHGAGVVPSLHKFGLESDSVLVSDADCVEGCHNLLKHESLLAGASSGGVISALGKYAEYIPDGANCVLLLCDSGTRYLDTVYNHQWIADNLA